MIKFLLNKLPLVFLIIGILGGIYEFRKQYPDGISFSQLAQSVIHVNAVPGKISAGNNYFLALNNEGDLLAWGDNENMQVGLDSRNFKHYYSEPFKLPSQSNWVYAAAGPRSAYAIDKNGLAWWHPHAPEGVTGNPAQAFKFSEANNMNYNLVDADIHWKSIKNSMFFAGGIDTGGALRLWDDSNLVSSNLMSTPESGTDAQPRKYLIADSQSGWQDFCLQGAVVYAVSSDGALWKNIDNIIQFQSNGIVQPKSFAQGSTNTLAMGRLDAKVKFKRVVCRENSSHVLMIDENNHLWGFGENTYGELGNGDGNKYTANEKVDESHPVLLSDKSWVDVAIGPGFTFGITADGNLWSWGNNAGGKLGTVSFEYREIPTLVDDKLTWVGVAANYSGGAAVTKEGDIYSWGEKVSQTPKLVYAQQNSNPSADSSLAEQAVSESEMIGAADNKAASSAVVKEVTAEGLPVFPKVVCNRLNQAHDARHVYCIGELNFWKRSLWQWDPSTGELAEYQIGGNRYMQSQEAFAVVEFGQDFVFITDRLELFRKGKADPIDSLTYVNDEHGNPRYGVGLAARAISKVSDHLFAMLSQRSYEVKSNRVGIVDIANDKLHLEFVPDLPGETRRGVALVTLPNNSIMALGGSWAPYLGNEPMTAETYILDLATKSWRPGPKMFEARTNATASLLPDGTVLVAGGWTPKNTWSDTPSRSTELWVPGSAGFVRGSPLSIGMADHQAQWWPNRNGKQLLLWGGFAKAWEGNYSVLALDRNGAWPTVGDWCVANSNTGDMTGVPLEHNGRPFMWCDGEVWPHTDPLRLSAWGMESLPRLDPLKGAALRRSGMAFLPPKADRPGMAVGGVAGADSAAVDAVWLDGRLQALAPLNYPRRNAKVLRLADGSILVAGGQGGDSSRRTQYDPPIELLPANMPLDQARWIDTGHHLPGSFIGPLGDGTLLAVDSAGNVEKLSISATNGKLVIQDSDFPSLNRGRIGQVKVGKLSNGRIVVAGGSVQYHKLALLNEESHKPGAPDQYVGVGEYTPAHGYEIYDPATKSWRESAFSDATSSTVAILDDGRVVKWGRIESADPWGPGTNASHDAPGKAVLEISSADGRTWSSFAEKSRLSIATDVAQQAPELFVIQGELFLSGKRPTDVTEDHWRGVAAVQWFNASKSSWETMWEAPDNNWRDDLGRIIIRDLPNGKHIILPVAGFKEY